MTVAVIGSRTFTDYDRLAKVLNGMTITRLVSGGAKGADSLAEKWAAEMDIPVTIFKPDWNRLGKSAGFVRNQDIVMEAEIVIAFWDNNSSGTRHSIELAGKLGKPVHIEFF